MVPITLMGFLPHMPNPRTSMAEPLGGIPHGTCVSSCAVGRRFGVAKNAKFVPVKFKHRGRALPAAITDGWLWAINHKTTSTNPQRPSVINYSHGTLPQL
jgi:hypothetical protein